jgi:hypothetical protein
VRAYASHDSQARIERAICLIGSEADNERDHSQDRHGGRRDAYRDGQASLAADPARGGDCRDRKPFAGRYVEDLSPLIAIGEELGDLLSKKAVAALGIDGAKAHSYGKAAAVGENGELEHAAAICIRRWARRCARS